MGRTFLLHVAAVFLVSCAGIFVHAAERSFGEHEHRDETCQLCAGQHHEHAAPAADAPARFFPRARYAAKPRGGSHPFRAESEVPTTRGPPLPFSS